MNTILVYTKSVKQDGRTFNSEVKRVSLDVDLAGIQGAKDYVVDADGKLLKVLEKIADLGSKELRVLVREM